MLGKNSKIYIAGHTGLVGSALIRKLQNDGYSNLLTCDHGDLDLINQSEVNTFFSEQQPEFVFLAAARVGGIHANSAYPAEFIYENLAIQTNIIHAAWKNNVKKLLFFTAEPTSVPKWMQISHICILIGIAQMPRKKPKKAESDFSKPRSLGV